MWKFTKLRIYPIDKLNVNYYSFTSHNLTSLIAEYQEGRLKFMKSEKKPRKEMDAITLGNIIKEERLSSNLTQAELAYRSNVNESYLSAVENGYSFVSISKFLALCDGLDVDPTDIMCELVSRRAEYHQKADPYGENSADNDWFINT